MSRVLCFTRFVNCARFVGRYGEVRTCGDRMGDQFLRGGIAVRTFATLDSLFERGLLRSLDSDGGTQGAARYHHGR